MAKAEKKTQNIQHCEGFSCRKTFHKPAFLEFGGLILEMLSWIPKTSFCMASLRLNVVLLVVRRGAQTHFPQKAHNFRNKSLHRGFCTSGTRIWARILRNEFRTPKFWTRILGLNFLTPFFQRKRPPEKFTLEKFTFQNSPSKIQPRHRVKKFTLHLCRAIWVT